MGWQCPDTSSCCCVSCECKWMASFVALGWFPGCIVHFITFLAFRFTFFPTAHLLKQSFPRCLLVFLHALSPGLTFELFGQIQLNVKLWTALGNQVPKWRKCCFFCYPALRKGCLSRLENAHHCWHMKKYFTSQSALFPLQTELLTFGDGWVKLVFILGKKSKVIA